MRSHLVDLSLQAKPLPVEGERFGVALGEDGLDPLARGSSSPLVRERKEIANALDDYVESAAHGSCDYGLLARSFLWVVRPIFTATGPTCS